MTLAFTITALEGTKMRTEDCHAGESERTSLVPRPELVTAPDEQTFSWRPAPRAQPHAARQSRCRDASSGAGPARGSSARKWRTPAPAPLVALSSACRGPPRSETPEASGSARAIEDTSLEPRRRVDTLWHRRRVPSPHRKTAAILPRDSYLRKVPPESCPQPV